MEQNSRQSPTWRSFLTPGWIMSLIAIVAFSYFAFTVLAPWQLHKNTAIGQRNEQIDQAFKKDPVPFTTVFALPEGTINADQEWTRVSMSGQFLPDHEVLLRLRSVNDNPAYQVLTPFRTDNGEVFLINRGYVPSGEGIPPIDPAPTNPTHIEGVARLDEALPNSQPLDEGGYHQVYGINTEQVSQITRLPLAHDYVQLTSGSVGELTAIPVPKLDRGSHLSYGLQWIGFGIMAPAGLIYFVYAELKERRRERKESEELEAAEGKSDDSLPTTSIVPAEETELVSRQSVQDRYGGQHRNYWQKRQAKKSRERF
ncbi:SURF1 family protein [Corynebacterium poyangense]|uniref:SURF1-like protein n=1 Tax=Corynebacterium poyangense TaxID=2684405 RepID=A0A7H0SSE8_9CORY|nr:SURF1 family protein [Corynebacterium poyangense]QNQ91473.1 SURF1 family protein [Corynebacterium poyangense]